MLTPDQLQIRDLAREFAEREVRPHVDEWEHAGAIPREMIDQLAELGFLGMRIPEEWDGLGLDVTSYLVALEQIAWGNSALAVAMSVHNSLPTQMILAHGSEEQMERWLKPMARGELLGVFALSEAEAGSDAAALTSQARRVDGGWVLDGSKAFITNGGFGDLAVVMCRTDEPDDRRGAKGIGAFIVPTASEGWIVGKKEDKLGLRASPTVQLSFDNLRVPAANLLGAEGSGFVYALQSLDNGRLGIAAQALGIARAAMEHSVAYAAERRQFGKPIKEFEAIQFKLADMATRITAARALLYSAAAAKDRGAPITQFSSMSKLLASETAMWVTTQAIQIFGGYGYVKDYPVERLFRDAKVTEIYEGTSEIQRIVIARELYAS